MMCMTSSFSARASCRMWSYRASASLAHHSQNCACRLSEALEGRLLQSTCKAWCTATPRGKRRVRSTGTHADADGYSGIHHIPTLTRAVTVLQRERERRHGKRTHTNTQALAHTPKVSRPDRQKICRQRDAHAHRLDLSPSL